MTFHEWQIEFDRLEQEYNIAHDEWLHSPENEEAERKEKLNECRAAWLNH